jgi:hypothetical protein
MMNDDEKVTKNYEGEIKIVDTGLTTVSGKRIAFILVRNGQPNIQLWEETLQGEDSPEARLLRDAFQFAYALGHEDGAMAAY